MMGRPQMTAHLLLEALGSGEWQKGGEEESVRYVLTYIHTYIQLGQHTNALKSIVVSL